jgi:hypothetical protein
MIEGVIITDASWRIERIWGAAAIAKFAGVSVDTIYRWERIEDCPITRPGGRYFSMRTPLAKWMLTKPMQGLARSCKVLPDKSRSYPVDEAGRETA